MLKPLNLEGWNMTAWCVPSAIAMLTGAPVGHMHVRAAFIQNTALKDVKGVFTEEAVLLLREQGYKAIPIRLTERYNKPPTIRQFLNDRTAYEFSMPIMFSTPKHMMVAHMGFAGDNWTKKPVAINQFPKLGRLVESAWVVMEDV